jgi:hypothetical protein
MNVEIGTETLIFLFWEYLFRNFGILSLQCIMTGHRRQESQEGTAGVEQIAEYTNGKDGKQMNN